MKARNRSSFDQIVRAGSLPPRTQLRELLPHPPLLRPIRNRRNRPQILLGDYVPASNCRRQKQDLLLDIRRKAKRVYDL